MLIAAIVLALLAAFLYALAAVFQQEEAASQPANSAMRPGLLVRLFKNPRWLGGLGLDWLGYMAEAIALGLATIVVIIPLLQSGLLFALFIEARRTKQPLQRPDWIAAIVLCAGLTGFLVTAGPTGGIDRPTFAAWLPWLIGLGGAAGVCAFIGAVGQSTARAVSWGLAAGCCYGMTGPLTKTVVSVIGTGDVLSLATTWETYALIGFSAFGMLFNQSAFQAGNLPASLPAMTIAIPLLATAIGLWVFREDVSVSGWLDGAAIIGFGLAMIIGVGVLAKREALRRGRAEAASARS